MNEYKPSDHPIMAIRIPWHRKFLRSSRLKLPLVWPLLSPDLTVWPEIGTVVMPTENPMYVNQMSDIELGKSTVASSSLDSKAIPVPKKRLTSTGTLPKPRKSMTRGGGNLGRSVKRKLSVVSKLFKKLKRKVLKYYTSTHRDAYPDLPDDDLDRTFGFAQGIETRPRTETFTSTPAEVTKVVMSSPSESADGRKVKKATRSKV